MGINEIIGFLIVLFIFFFPLLRKFLIGKQQKQQQSSPQEQAMEEEESEQAIDYSFDTLEQKEAVYAQTLQNPYLPKNQVLQDRTLPPFPPSSSPTIDPVVGRDFEFHTKLEKRKLYSPLAPKMRVKTKKQHSIQELLQKRSAVQNMVILYEIFGPPKSHEP